MQAYETMFIARPDLEEEKLQALVDKFTQLIVDHQGEVVKVDLWGKRRLAYEVEKFREGIYVLINFKAAPDFVQELERIYRITDEVLRYLVVKQEEA